MAPEFGVTFAPLMALGLPAALDLATTAEQLGYRSFWTAEVTGPEAFSLRRGVAAGAVAEPRYRRACAATADPTAAGHGRRQPAGAGSRARHRDRDRDL